MQSPPLQIIFRLDESHGVWICVLSFLYFVHLGKKQGGACFLPFAPATQVERRMLFSDSVCSSTLYLPFKSINLRRNPRHCKSFSCLMNHMACVFAFYPACTMDPSFVHLGYKQEKMPYFAYLWKQKCTIHSVLLLISKLQSSVCTLTRSAFLQVVSSLHVIYYTETFS